MQRARDERAWGKLLQVQAELDEMARTEELRREVQVQPSTSKREMLRRARDERARGKHLKMQAKRDEMVRKGVKCCDVVGCSEPRTARGRRICAVHWGAEELVLEGEATILRWCMHCYALHPLAAFSAVSRTICSEKYEFRKQRRADRLNANTPKPEEVVIRMLAPASSLPTCRRRSCLDGGDACAGVIPPNVPSPQAASSAVGRFMIRSIA
jgi:hypothetical protein